MGNTWNNEDHQQREVPNRVRKENINPERVNQTGLVKNEIKVESVEEKLNDDVKIRINHSFRFTWSSHNTSVGIQSLIYYDKISLMFFTGRAYGNRPFPYFLIKVFDTNKHKNIFDIRRKEFQSPNHSLHLLKLNDDSTTFLCSNVNTGRNRPNFQIGGQDTTSSNVRLFVHFFSVKFPFDILKTINLDDQISQFIDWRGLMRLEYEGFLFRLSERMTLIVIGENSLVVFDHSEKKVVSTIKSVRFSSVSDIILSKVKSERCFYINSSGNSYIGKVNYENGLIVRLFKTLMSPISLETYLDHSGGEIIVYGCRSELSRGFQLENSFLHFLDTSKSGVDKNRIFRKIEIGKLPERILCIDSYLFIVGSKTTLKIIRFSNKKENENEDVHIASKLIQEGKVMKKESRNNIGCNNKKMNLFENLRTNMNKMNMEVMKFRYDNTIDLIFSSPKEYSVSFVSVSGLTYSSGFMHGKKMKENEYLEQDMKERVLLLKEFVEDEDSLEEGRSVLISLNNIKINCFRWLLLC